MEYIAIGHCLCGCKMTVNMVEYVDVNSAKFKKLYKCEVCNGKGMAIKREQDNVAPDRKAETGTV